MHQNKLWHSPQTLVYPRDMAFRTAFITAAMLANNKSSGGP